MVSKKLSRSEPVSELKRVPIQECGEPLVNFRTECPELLVQKPFFTYRLEPYARKSLAERLALASSRLPPGYRLAVLECWRAPVIQMRMYRSVWNMFRERNPNWSETHLRRVVNQFSAPMDLAVPPPHTTGGAVDLSLTDDQGDPVDLRSPYELRDPKGYYFEAKGLSEVARKNRDILAEALVGAGITNYPSEYWHWSYGDQGWAYRGSHAGAIYGAITPDGWTIDPADDTEEALEYLTPESETS